MPSFYFLEVLIVFIGVALRLAHFFFNNSLWLDEAHFALRLAGDSSGNPLNPEAYRQTAPIGFALSTKIVTSAVGMSEYSLRFAPVLAAVLVFPLLRSVLSQIKIGAWTRLLVLALFALCPTLIRYAADARPYAFDVLFPLFQLYLALKELKKGKEPGRLFYGISAILVFFSHPSLFVGLGVLFEGAVRKLSEGGPRQVLRFVINRSPYLVFIACYAELLLFGIVPSAQIHTDWNKAMVPWAMNWESLWWWPQRAISVFRYPFSFPFPAITLLLFLVGNLNMRTLHPTSWKITISSLFMTLIASCAHLYPFEGRLILFTVPMGLVLVGLGAQSVIDWLPKIAVTKASAVLLSLFLVLPLGAKDLRALTITRAFGPKEEIKPVLSFLSRKIQANDSLYIYYGAIDAFTYYAKKFNFPNVKSIEGHSHRAGRALYDSELAAIPATPRLWVVFTHVYSSEQGTEESYFLKVLTSHGRKIEEFHAPGASCYLFEWKKKETGGTLVPPVL